MTSFEYLSVMRRFLMTYPYETPYTMIDIWAQQADNPENYRDTTILQLNGRGLLGERKNVIGKKIRRERMNFALVMWRGMTDDFMREATVNFMSHMVNWINQEASRRNMPDKNIFLPQFSMTDYETLTAQENGQIAMLSPEIAEFQLGIHAEFEIVY